MQQVIITPPALPACMLAVCPRLQAGKATFYHLSSVHTMQPQQITVSFLATPRFATKALLPMHARLVFWRHVIVKWALLTSASFLIDEACNSSVNERLDLVCLSRCRLPCLSLTHPLHK